MKFSVIIGTYNQKATLPRTLSELAGQHDSMEVHVCDDGSDYDVQLLVDALNLPYPVYVHQQKHEGMRLARNLNQGVRKARGEYCAFLMGDSYPRHDWLAELDSHVSRVTVISSFRINVDDHGTPISYDWRFGNQRPQTLQPIIGPLDPTQPWQSMTGNGLVVPTWFLRETGGWCEAYEGYGKDDWDLVMQAHKRRLSCFTLTTAILYHRDHPGQPDNPESTRIFERRVHERFP